MEKISIKAVDGYGLELHLFEVKNAKAVVQVIHGMEEHQGRYEELAKILNDAGFTVLSSDLRGHGFNASHLGNFADKNGYKKLIEDQIAITDEIKKRYKNLDVYIFAHSMGTIITRVLLKSHSKDYKKVILSGYPKYNREVEFGIILGNVIKFFKGSRFKSRLLEEMSVGSFNKKIASPKSFNDWISYNEDNIKKYNSDPYCGKGFTVSAFLDLFHLVKEMHKPYEYRLVSKELKFLFLAGEDDVCTGGYKGRSDSIKILRLAGFNDIKEKVYPHMRHEIINENGNKEVFEDILKFFS